MIRLSLLLLLLGTTLWYYEVPPVLSVVVLFLAYSSARKQRILRKIAKQRTCEIREWWASWSGGARKVVNQLRHDYEEARKTLAEAGTAWRRIPARLLDVAVLFSATSSEAYLIYLTVPPAFGFPSAVNFPVGIPIALIAFLAPFYSVEILRDGSPKATPQDWRGGVVKIWAALMLLVSIVLIVLVIRYRGDFIDPTRRPDSVAIVNLQKRLTYLAASMGFGLLFFVWRLGRVMDEMQGFHAWLRWSSAAFGLVVADFFRLLVVLLARLGADLFELVTGDDAEVDQRAHPHPGPSARRSLEIAPFETTSGSGVGGTVEIHPRDVRPSERVG